MQENSSVISFIALEPLDWDNGLAALGNPMRKYSLQGGQALHVKTDAAMHFPGNCEPESKTGLALILCWR